MSARLPRILAEGDLPYPELCAARLDGEIFAVDGCFAVVDECDELALRAGALARVMPAATVVERASAFWLYGLTMFPPARHTLCIPTSARARVAWSPRWLLRECVLSAAEIGRVGGVPVVTPLRAAVDLLRVSAEFGGRERQLLDGLQRLGGFADDEIWERLQPGRSVPGNRRAIQRIRQRPEAA